MSRLIDADELKDIIQGNEDLIDFQKEEMCNCVDTCDTAYDIDDVVMEFYQSIDYDGYASSRLISIDSAIETVKAGGKNE